MISKILYTLEFGFKRLKQNTKLIFVVVILFVFPLLFVLVLEQFYAVSEANSRTVENQYISGVHDSAAIVASYSVADSASVFSTLQQTNQDLLGYRIYGETSDSSLVILASSQPDEVLATTTAPTLIRTTLQEAGQTFTTQVLVGGVRVMQSARHVVVDGTQLYLYTEHSFATQDNLFTKRKQDAYMLLSLFFVFVIALAFWINRQSDWERQYTKLKSTLKERDLFSNMIAHEFRTPLTAIKGYASFLQESQTVTSEEKRYADTIAESAERLVLLVNDFLEIARIQSGRMNIEATQVDVRDAITSVNKSLKEEAAAKGLQLIYTPDLKPQLLATDQNRFIQILTNIVSNSVKYTDKGTVEISCENDRNGVTIRVKDTGMGISAEDQQKLFAPFSRVGGVEKTTTTGTGLGMWITKQMIELLNGSIAVESIKGVGTHVVLTFGDVKTPD